MIEQVISLKVYTLIILFLLWTILVVFVTLSISRPRF